MGSHCRDCTSGDDLSFGICDWSATLGQFYRCPTWLGVGIDFSRLAFVPDRRGHLLEDPGGEAVKRAEPEVIASMPPLGITGASYVGPLAPRVHLGTAGVNGGTVHRSTASFITGFF